MAKRKWFLDYFCAVVAKSVVRQCCKEMELSRLETRLILERFCDKKGLCGCDDFYPVGSQKNHLPMLDAKVRGWVERNLNLFKPSEIVFMYDFLRKSESDTAPDFE